MRPAGDAAFEGLGRTVARASALLLAVLVGLATLVAFATPITPGRAFAMAVETLSAGFVAALLALVLVVLVACLAVAEAAEQGALLFWRDVGFYAAGGIATLSLTWTLFGISLGIGSLSRTELVPATIQAVIADLTRHFGMAFATTIVGLPLATLLRAVVGLHASRRQRLLSGPPQG